MKKESNATTAKKTNDDFNSERASQVGLFSLASGEVLIDLAAGYASK